eukprot:1143774-Pelagomonas_calceolata.AAC.10
MSQDLLARQVGGVLHGDERIGAAGVTDNNDLAVAVSHLIQGAALGVSGCMGHVLLRLQSSRSLAVWLEAFRAPRAAARNPYLCTVYGLANSRSWPSSRQAQGATVCCKRRAWQAMRITVRTVGVITEDVQQRPSASFLDKDWPVCACLRSWLPEATTSPALCFTQ